MVSINPSQAQARTQAHAPRAAQANAAQQIPATNFGRHFAIADGDCVFRVLHMDLTNQPGVQASNERVMELRQAAANYVAEHRQALIAHPSFGGAAGVNDLYDLLMTQGQWNEDAGDLVAPILARVLGRELRILQPAQKGGVYEMNDNRIFRPQDPGLPAGRPDTGQPPIHLLHTGNRTHYEYLESRYPQADATAGSVHTHTRPVAHSIDDRGAPPSPEAFPLRSVSPSLWLEEFMRSQENSSLDDVAQPPRKRRRKAGLEQQDITSERLTQTPLGKRQVQTQAARTEIRNAFTQVNNRAFETLTQGEQDIEVARISRETGYRKFGIRITLTGGGTKKVKSQKARTEISNAFAQTNSRAFAALTQDEQDAEVTRISQETGYRQIGVRTTLTGGGNNEVRSQVARTEISNAFAQTNSRAFAALTQDEQDAEVTRISRETGYVSFGVRATLSGEGIKSVRSKKARTEIINAFAQVNDSAFRGLTKDEQDAEVARISQETGYIKSGVRTVLIAGGNTPVRTQGARTEISKAFAQANERALGALTQNEQDAEITRISREKGYERHGVQTTLIGVGNTPVRSQAARTEISNAFKQVNNRAFGTLTQGEQTDEVARISRETGYNLFGVRTTLSGRGNKQVKSRRARTEISNVFAQANNRAFETLTQVEQDTEVARISRKTGYRASGVRITLTGGGNLQIQTQAARTQIINAFTLANKATFGELTQEEQDAEVTRISRDTGYNPSGVRATLSGRDNKL